MKLKYVRNTEKDLNTMKDEIKKRTHLKRRGYCISGNTASRCWLTCYHSIQNAPSTVKPAAINIEIKQLVAGM